ncbi:hypothetical protein ACE939_05230 [Aquimarina sp. W85]|uniref:hypothetical protein n=1 Tax=Aquimarina rhodophyticola TaxID=3342246 RepID=UPI00366BF066
MKRLLLPIALLSFAVICLSIVHLNNIRKLDKESNELREKQFQLDQDLFIESESEEETNAK